jgi:hypothetical protein
MEVADISAIILVWTMRLDASGSAISNGIHAAFGPGFFSSHASTAAASAAA